jgi:hypothetical protein
VLLVLQASPQVNFDLRRVDVQKLARSKHRLERLQRVLVMSKNPIGLKTQVLERLLEETLGQRYCAIF